MPPIDSKTTNEAAEQITRRGLSWTGEQGQAGGTITFGFRDTAPPTRAPGNPGANLTGTFTKMNAGQITAVTEILNLWSDLTRIEFDRVGSGLSGTNAYSNNATMLFGNYGADEGAAAFTAEFPNKNAKGAGRHEGDVWANTYRDAHIATDADLANAPPTISKPVAGSEAFMILMHEIGHALGLDHPANYRIGPDFSYSNNAGYKEDSQQYTVMSYFPGSSTNANYGPIQNPLFPETPMLHDIAAIQRVYGVNRLTRTGDTVYGFNSNANHDAYKLKLPTDQAVFAVWDAGGEDTFDFSGYFDRHGSGTVIDLRPGHFSSVGGLKDNIAVAARPPGVSDAFDYLIENAIGTRGDDTIHGNERENRLFGHNGNDVLRGGDKNDILEGGRGQDELFGDDGGDTAVFRGDRADYVILPVFGQPGSFEIEEKFGNRDEGEDKLHSIRFAQFRDGKIDLSTLVFTTPPNPNPPINIPNGNDPAYTGGAGDDSIIGGSSTNSISGLGGNDFLRVTDNGFATPGPASLSGGDGDDALQGRSTGDTLNGDANNDSLKGGPGDDVLNGGVGQDILSGEGEKDTLNGDAGNDTLEGGRHEDKVNGGIGNDILTGDGFGENGADVAAAADEINGDDGDDRLTSDWGADQLAGGSGIDLAIIRRTTSQQELTLLLKPTDLTNLGDGTTLRGIERVQFEGGTKDDRATGFNFDDVLRGNGGDDVLEGLGGEDVLFGDTFLFGDAAGNDRLDGGAGADVMAGGAGNDRYFVDHPGDLIDEGAGSNTGNDTVFIDGPLPYILSVTADIEEIRGIADKMVVTANSFDTTFVGTDGNDIIDGGFGADTVNGGEGHDSLNGGGGVDIVRGGKGNDIIFVDTADDKVAEAAGEGIDTVHFATVPGQGAVPVYALGAKAHVEVLDTTDETLFGLKLVGNNFNNDIRGNSRPGTLEGKGGNDVLNGKLGSDDLVGGTGKDTFVFSTAIANGSPFGSRYTNIDTINDFTTFVDKIQLDDVIFANAKAAPSHRLLASDFSVDSANPGNAHIILDKTTGRLFYDPDAAGGALRIHFATVLSGPSPAADLTAFDILLV